MILNIYKSDLVALCYDLHLCLIVNSAAAEINVLKPEVLWRSLPKLGKKKKMQKIVIFVSFTNLLLILVSLPSRIIVNKIHVRICRPSPLPQVNWIAGGICILFCFGHPAMVTALSPGNEQCCLKVHWFFCCSLLDSLEDSTSYFPEVFLNIWVHSVII